MKKNVIKTFTFMFSAMFIAKVLGLLRNVVFARFYGTTLESTAFFTASRIPTQLLDITLGAAISSTFIPVFNEFLQRDGKKRAYEFATNFLNVIMIISATLSLIGIALAPTIVKFIAPELNIEIFDLTVLLTRILFPAMLFTAIAFVFVGFLQSLDEFNIPAIISVASNGLLIAYLLIFNNKFGITGVAIAMLIGWITQILVQLPSVKKKGFKYSFKTNFKDEGLKRVVFLALPILVSSWVQPINNIVNIRLASGLLDGKAVPAIEYAYTLFLMIVGVFSYTLSNIIFPELSKLNTDNNKEKFNEIVKTSVKVTAMFVLPMAVGLFFLSHNIIKLVYERGEFTPESTYLTASALGFYAIGMIGYGIMEVLNKVFYSLQDSKTPMKTSIFAIVLNILLSVFLVNKMGYIGLPLAASITSITTGIIMLVLAFKKMKTKFEKEMVIELLKYIVATIIMGIAIYFAKMLPLGPLLQTILCLFVGVIIYFGTLVILREKLIMKYINK